MELLRVAIRNVGRNKRRSLITIITVIIGVAMLTGIRGVLNGLQGELVLALTQKVHGDLQIHKTGYRDSVETSPFKTMMRWLADDERRVMQTGAVRSVSPRLRLMGLFNHQASQTTVPVPIMAIDSVKELAVCPRFKETVRDGELFDSSRERMSATAAAGSTNVDDPDLVEVVPLKEKAPVRVEAVQRTVSNGTFHQVMVTPALLTGSGARIGDEVVVLVQDKNNMQQAMVATIAGVIDYGLPTAQNRMIWVDFRTMQELLGVPGEVSELAVSVQDPEQLNETRTKIQDIMGNDRIVETWSEIAGFFRDVMAIQNAVFNVITFVVFIIVVSAIVNTSLMTVMERTREVGTLMALGYRRRHILWLFLVESMAIGVTGGVAGLALMTGVLQLLSARGLAFRLPGQTVTTVLYPYVSAQFVILVLVLAVIAALVAAFVPSYRASRMRPVEALATS